MCRIKIHKTFFFQIVKRSSESLNLIHSDIGDLKFMQTKGEKKYFIIFIEKCTRYCYTYLLRIKDESLEMFKHYHNEVENQFNNKNKGNKK